MTELLPIIIVFLGLIVLISIRIPVGLALISVSFFGIAYETNLRAAVGSIARVPYEFATDWSFSAVPMFLLMGFIASEMGLTKGLFSASRVVLSRVPGALACASVLASALFAAASGSSVATASAMSRIAIPEMLNRKYDPGLAAGTVAAAGTLGSLIPPSILMILYGIYADVSIGKLFVAGVLPGILSAVMYIGMIVVRTKLNPELEGGQQEPDTTAQKVSSGKIISDLLPLPILVAIVMGSISFGLATPTEAGALGAMGAVIMALATGNFDVKAFVTALFNTARTFTSIFIIVIGGALLTRYTAVAGLSEMLKGLFAATAAGQMTLLIGVSIIYIILGMFIETIGLLLLTTPLIVPLATALNVDLIWLGIILVKLLEIGLITPPVGLNIFVIQSSVGDKISMPVIVRGVLWFVAVDLITLSLLIAFPSISVWLPAFLNN